MEISQKVITLLVSLCKLHQQQRSVTNHVKKPVMKPLMADGFLKHVEIDLIDFRKLPCTCNATHKWVLHITDHSSKFTWLYPLHSKETEEVVEALEKQFCLFSFPTMGDNGREFKSKKMAEFCKVHKIKQVHGAPRTPTTQGLVERNNRTVKENMKNIITKKNDEEVNWCKTLSEAVYKKNIFVHSATGKSPYEAVFGILPRKEVHVSADVEKLGKESTPVTDFQIQIKGNMTGMTLRGRNSKQI